jgi:anti-sigma regulatory factor (Ser/Thr protein kinase)/anti-anti-sigma regulatory factor
VPLPDGRVALIVGDVVGHGIGASSVMGRLRSLLSERLADGADLAPALSALDRSARRVAGAEAATVGVAIVDASSGRVDYCTAGHPPPLVVRAGEWRYLETTGAGPLGSGAGFPIRTAELGEGDLILLYTDGLVERPARTAAQATVEIGHTVADALAGRPLLSGASTHPPDRVCEQSLELLTRITGYSDDITVLAARRIGPPAALRVDARADAYAPTKLAAELELWLAAVDAGPSDLAALRHAVVELVSNTVDHAYRHRLPGSVALRADLDPDGHATITVADDGRWREPADAIEDTRARGDHRFRGLGLAMVRETVDEFALEHGTTGTTARLRRRLRRPAPLLAAAPGAAGRQAPPDLQDRLVITPDGPDRLAVRGPLHLGTTGALESRLAMETRGGTRSLVLDLSGLTHLASAGVQLLQQARRTARNHHEDLALVASPGSVADHVLELVAVDHDSDVRLSPDDPLWR